MRVQIVHYIKSVKMFKNISNVPLGSLNQPHLTYMKASKQSECSITA
jgi:hypothetical protein